MEEISKQGAFILASYLIPASLLTLTPEIVDRLFYVYQTDLPRKVDSVDEVLLKVDYGQCTTVQLIT